MDNLNKHQGSDQFVDISLMTSTGCNYLQQSPEHRGSRSGAGPDPPWWGRSWCRTDRFYIAARQQTIHLILCTVWSYGQILTRDKKTNIFKASHFKKWSDMAKRTSSLTSSQFWSSFTQKRARWKLLLSVKSEKTQSHSVTSSVRTTPAQT